MTPHLTSGEDGESTDAEDVHVAEPDPSQVSSRHSRLGVVGVMVNCGRCCCCVLVGTLVDSPVDSPGVTRVVVVVVAFALLTAVVTFHEPDGEEGSYRQEASPEKPTIHVPRLTICVVYV